MKRTSLLCRPPGACGRGRGFLARGMGWAPVALASVPLASILVASIAFAAPAFAGRDAEMRRHPGFVDGSMFVELAGEDSELVEVSLGPALLKAIARGGADDPGARGVLSGLLGVNAYIVGLENDAAREARAAKLVMDTARRLEASGWERLVRVREKSESVNVYVRNNDETIDGLVVLVFDDEGSEVVFVNLVGTIDLARLGEIEGTLDVPGLDAIDDVEKAAGAGKGTPASPKKRRAKDEGAR